MLNKLNFLQERLNGLITKSKFNYLGTYGKQANNLQRNSKTYWSLLKCFLNNKKYPLIPPLFHDNKFVTDFLEKAELFNSFFFKTLFPKNNRLFSVTFSQDNIARIIQYLDSGKAHGDDNISICMLKICGP